jgi:hypothetical protein
MHTGFWCGNLKERGNLENQGVDGRMILILVLRKYTRKDWTGLIWLTIGTSTGCCEHGYELSVSIK